MAPRAGWYKMYDDELDDPKVARLSDLEFRVWHAALGFCNRSPARLRERGWLFHSAGFPVEPVDFARHLGRSEQEIITALLCLTEIGGSASLLLKGNIDGGVAYQVRAWRKRQRGEAGESEIPISSQFPPTRDGTGESEIPISSQFPPNFLPISSQFPPSLSPADIDIDIDKRQKTQTQTGREGGAEGGTGAVAPRKKRAAPPPTAADDPPRASWSKEVAALQSIPGYPFDEAKDRALLDALAEAYTQLDLAQELRKMKSWLASKGWLPLQGQQGPRQRVRRWMQKADEIMASKGGGDGTTRSSVEIRRSDAGPREKNWHEA